MQLFVSLCGLLQEGVVAARALVMVPLCVKDQVTPPRPDIVADITLVIFDLVMYRLDMLLEE